MGCPAMPRRASLCHGGEDMQVWGGMACASGISTVTPPRIEVRVEYLPQLGGLVSIVGPAELLHAAGVMAAVAALGEALKAVTEAARLGETGDPLVNSDLTRAQLVALLRQAQTERDAAQLREMNAENALTKAELKLSVLGNPDVAKHEVVPPDALEAEWAPPWLRCPPLTDQIG